MKGTALFFITMVVGSLANPVLEMFAEAKQERLVTGQIIRAIEKLSQDIREAGLDPLNINEAMEYKLPVPVLFAASAIVENFLTVGLSDIAINRMNYSAITNRLTFDLSLPRIEISIGNAGYDVTLFGDEYLGSASGRLVITQPRITGDIRVNVGIISGISIRSIVLEFSLESIQSNLNLKLFGYDLSTPVNNVLAKNIPAKLREFKKEINELLVMIAWQAAESVL